MPEQQLAFIRKVMNTDKVITVGVVYNPGEDNSHTLNLAMQKAAEKMNINMNIKLSAALRTCDVQGAAARLLGTVDAIIINNDNTALAAFPSIVRVCSGKIPVFVSDVDIVEQGAAGAVGANQYVLGTQTAEIVLRIANGESASVIPVEYPRQVDVQYNQVALKSLGLTVRE